LKGLLSGTKLAQPSPAREERPRGRSAGERAAHR